MTFEEAKQAMMNGQLITHEYFSHEEFMYYNAKDRCFYSEDGVKINWSLFWLDRTEPDWQSGYKFFEP